MLLQPHDQQLELLTKCPAMNGAVYTALVDEAKACRVEGSTGAQRSRQIAKSAASHVGLRHAGSQRAGMSRRSARCCSVASSLPGGCPAHPAAVAAGASAVTSATAAKIAAWSTGPRASTRACPPMISSAATCAVQGPWMTP